MGKDQYQFNAKSGSDAPIFGSNWRAQTFTPAASGNLTSLFLSIIKSGTTADLIVSIRATSGGVPTGSDLAVETIPSANVGSSNVNNLEVTFSSPPSLTAGTQYAIVVRSPSASSGSYRWQFAHGITAGTADYYSGGKVYLSSDSGSTWPDDRDSDFAFVTVMDTTAVSPELDIHIFGTDATSVTVDSSNDQFAQTFEPTISGDLSKVAFAVTKAATQTGGNVIVEIQGVNGSNEPDGIALASESISDSVISDHSDGNDVAVQEVTFASPASLTSGVRYALVLKFPSAGGGGSYRVGNSESVDQYINGSSFSSNDNGSTWSAGSYDLELGTFTAVSIEVSQDIDSDANIEAETSQNISSDAFVGQETIKTIDSDATVEGEQTQSIQSDAQIGSETSQTIDGDAVVEAESEQNINSNANIKGETSQNLASDANVSGETTKQISGGAFISQPVEKTIDSNATIVVQNPSLKLFSSANPSVEVGTVSNPIEFSGVIAGENFEHPDNPFYLWNDKGGLLGAKDAREVTIDVLSLAIKDELIGSSDGTASQTFSTAFSPVVEDDLTDHPITIKVNGVVWTRIDTLSTTDSDDEVYAFDFDTGVVTFGDGVNGKIPTLGDTIEATYSPKDIEHGFEVEESNWLGVKSDGVVNNSVTANLERQISLDANTVQVSRQNITSVSGVFLNNDGGGFGTNYFTGGSFNSPTGVITLGTSLPSANTTVLVTYTYEIQDDSELDFTQVGEDTQHEFLNPIPSNNAKSIFLRLSPPANASPSGLVNISFKIRINFKT